MALTKAIIINLDADIPLPIPVMFNPDKYSISSNIQFNEVKVPGAEQQPLQYAGNDNQTLSLDLFFDTTDTGVDVRTRTASILALATPQQKNSKVIINALLGGTSQESAQKSIKEPPRLKFIWGTLVFPCVMSSIKQNFDYFNALGMPLRATLTVEFKGYSAVDAALGQLPLPLMDQAARISVTQNETLQSIASNKLNNPKKWRQIAERNGIDNPRANLQGLNLIIPGALR